MEMNPAPPRMMTSPLSIGFHTSQVVVWDIFHQQYDSIVDVDWYSLIDADASCIRWCASSLSTPAKVGWNRWDLPRNSNIIGPTYSQDLFRGGNFCIKDLVLVKSTRHRNSIASRNYQPKQKLPSTRGFRLHGLELVDVCCWPAKFP